MKAIRSFSENAPSDKTIQHLNTRFYVMGSSLKIDTALNKKTKNDISSRGNLSLYNTYVTNTSQLTSPAVAMCDVSVLSESATQQLESTYITSFILP